MEFLKKNIRTIIGFITGVILASSITVYAYSYFASDIKYTKKDGTEISVENALNELYSKNNITFTGDFYLSATADENTYSNTSYFDINVNNYSKITFNIDGLFPSTSVFTSYILADGTNVKNITQIGEFEIDTSSVSTIRVYYYENGGYYFMSGTYTLSN